MKKIIYIISLLLVFNTIAMDAKADNSDGEAIQSKTDRYIKYVYDKLSFKKMQKLSFEAFSKGFYGYLNIKEAGKVSGNALLTICDFNLSSNLKRMWVIDVAKKKVLVNSLVAHGMGSGEEFATKFSNTHESHQSSLGFYTTGETYQGDNGYSLKLNGIDGSWNNNAFDRAIVIHGADYVCETFACANNRLGRSHGCPALPRATADGIINKIQNGSVLFIYHNSKKYLNSSYWLTNKIGHLPSEANSLEMMMPANTNPRWKELGETNDSIAKIQQVKNLYHAKNSSNDSSRVIPSTVQLPNKSNPGNPTAPAKKVAQAVIAPEKTKDNSRDFLKVH